MCARPQQCERAHFFAQPVCPVCCGATIFPGLRRLAVPLPFCCFALNVTRRASCTARPVSGTARTCSSCVARLRGLSWRAVFSPTAPPVRRTRRRIAVPLPFCCFAPDAPFEAVCMRIASPHILCRMIFFAVPACMPRFCGGVGERLLFLPRMMLRARRDEAGRKKLQKMRGSYLHLPPRLAIIASVGAVHACDVLM